jgi:hypothetical protein
MYSTISIPMHVPTYPMLPLTKPDFAAPPGNCCSQLKCKAELPDNKFKRCEKCQKVSRLGMQEKWKREQDDEGPSHAPPDNSHLEEESDTELQHKVSRFTFGC